MFIYSILSRSFKSVASIKNYISGVRTLHLLMQYPFPYLNEFSVKLLFKGLSRINPHLPKQAAPITLDILKEVRGFLNLKDCNDASYWCLFLFAFFLMARKSNLVPNSVNTFNVKKQLTRQKIFLHDNMAIVLFERSKTIQFGQRVLKIPLIGNPNSCLCPLSAYRNMCTLVPASPTSPAFLYTRQKDNKHTPITYTQFNNKIKSLIEKSGRNPALYSTHSFRRGGATFSFQSKIPSELIKLHGDWASDAYLLYIKFSLEDKIKVARQMVESLPY